MKTHLDDDVCHVGDDSRKMGVQSELELGKHVQRERDIFLCHNGANEPWVESLAEQLETVRYKDRYLGAVFDKWDFEKGKNIVLELERFIDDSRFVGLVVHFGEKKGLVFTIGYIPFLRCYPGFKIPQPLEISENWGSLSFDEVANDLLRLTKLNRNTAAFSCVDPITLAFSKRVGEILKMANVENPTLHHRYYM